MAIAANPMGVIYITPIFYPKPPVGLEAGTVAQILDSRYQVSRMDVDQIKALERIRELDGYLINLRAQLEIITSELAQNSTNTSLLIRRVNTMKLIMLAQSEIDTLRSKPKQV